MSETELICIDLNDDWWVKIVNNYGMTDFLNIKGNLRNIDSINSVEDIFINLILPTTKTDQYGHEIRWEIADCDNLYTLNELPNEYRENKKNPKCCFDSESENYHDPKPDQIRNYFDSTLIDFK